MFSTPNIRIRPPALENSYSLTAKKSVNTNVKKAAFQDISVNITPFKKQDQKKQVIAKTTNYVKKDVINRDDDDMYDLMSFPVEDEFTYTDIMSAAQFSELRDGFRSHNYSKTPPPKNIIDIDSKFFQPIEEQDFEEFHDSFISFSDPEDVSLPDISF